MPTAASTSLVTVWLLDVPPSLADGDRAALTAVLDANERERAGSLLHTEQRDTYVAAHALLRAALAAVGDRPATAWAFERVGRRKPTVTGGGVTFSVSHTPGFAACAVSRDVEVGIDVEAIRPVTDLNAFARVLSAEERQRLHGSPDAERNQLFWRIWTAKEAIGKATGRGLAERLASLTVMPTPNGFELAGDLPQPHAIVRPLDCGRDVVGALVAERNGPVEVRRLEMNNLVHRLRGTVMIPSPSTPGEG